MSGRPLPARRFAGRPDGALPGYVPGAEASTDESRAASREGVLWLVKAITGVLLIVSLGVHLVAQHFLVDGGLRDHAAVVAYLRHPVALVAELALLVSVITHAALGVRAVLVDVLPGETAVRRATWVIGIVGIGCLAYGVALTLLVLRS